MHHCTLRIRLCCPNPALEEALRLARPRPGCSHDFALVDLSRDVLPQVEGADVLLLDAARLALLPELRQKACARAMCILLEDRPGAALPDGKTLALLHDVWSGADSAALYAFRVERLLEAAGERQECARARRYLDTLMDCSPALIWFKDTQGVYLKVNESFCRQLGKARFEVEGVQHSQVLNLGTDNCLISDAQVMSQGRAETFEESVRTGQGMRQFKTRKCPLFDENGGIMGSVGIAHDVTALANMSSELNLILQSMPFAVAIVDTEEKIVNANGKFLELFGHVEKGDVIGMSGEELRARGTDIYGMQWLKDHREVCFSRGGSETVLTIYDRPIVDIFNNRMGNIVIFRDVSLERRFERYLKRKANTDELTGLFNRRYFYEKISADVAVGAALVYVDLDNFKNVNDQYGHHAGDRALVLTAQLLRESFPEAVIARLGGDEFVLYLPGGCTPEAVWAETQTLLGVMHRAFEADAEFTGLSASAGIVVADTGGLTRDELVRRGDVAMYEAKRLGKRQACFYSPALATAQNPKSSCRQNSRDVPR